MAHGDDDQDDGGDDGRELAVAMGGALVGAMGTGPALAAAVAGHFITNATTDASWRRATYDLWLDVLLDVEDKRRRNYQEARNEFEQHRFILQGLQDELSDLRQHVEDLKVVALGMLRDSENLLRQRPDPEMRPYLVNAWRNAVKRRDRFPPTWMRRLTEHLSTIGVEHLRLLERLMRIAGDKERARNGSLRVELRSADDQELLDRDGGLVFHELREAEILLKSSPSTHVHVSITGVRLAELVGIASIPDPLLLPHD